MHDCQEAEAADVVYGYVGILFSLKKKKKKKEPVPPYAATRTKLREDILRNETSQS